MILSDWLCGDSESEVWHIDLPLEWTWLEWHNAVISVCKYALGLDSYIPTVLITFSHGEIIVPQQNNAERKEIQNSRKPIHEKRLPDNVRMYGKTVSFERDMLVPDYIIKEHDYILGCDTIIIVCDSDSNLNLLRSMVSGYIEYDHILTVSSHDEAFDIIDRDTDKDLFGQMAKNIVA